MTWAAKLCRVRHSKRGWKCVGMLSALEELSWLPDQAWFCHESPSNHWHFERKSDRRSSAECLKFRLSTRMLWRFMLIWSALLILHIPSHFSCQSMCFAVPMPLMQRKRTLCRPQRLKGFVASVASGSAAGAVWACSGNASASWHVRL